MTSHLPTIFLDRDGVINRKLPGDYVKSWDEFEFLPGAIDALVALKRHGYRLVVATNQRGIGLGKFTEELLQSIHQRMTAEISRAGGGIDAIYYCPHEKSACSCRKPEVGMFLQAQRDFPDIQFSECFMIGDSASDMEAGARLKCRNVLIASESAETVSHLDLRNVKVERGASSLYVAVSEFLIPRGPG
jgi:D-glycero-D-manno-heptose 1,7-bisphosphate phosphatase